MLQKSLLKFPTTLHHDEHDHCCGCVKCYFNNIINIVKIEYVWMIEYISSAIVFNSEASKLDPLNLKTTYSPRSPPLL